MDGDRVELEDAIQYGDNLINKWKQQPKPHRPKAPRSHIPKMIRKHQRSQWTKADMDAFTGFGREA
jgi:hypothetical protein